MSKRDENTVCEWEGCEEGQFEDWYYCEYHANRVRLTNMFFGGFVR